MNAHTSLLPFATEQARKCYESQRKHDPCPPHLPDPNHWDKVERLGCIHGYFNAGDYLNGQAEAIEFAKVYNTQMPRILVEFTNLCQAVGSWTSPQP